MTKPFCASVDRAQFPQRRLLPASLAILFLLTLSACQSGAPRAESSEEADRVAGEYLVETSSDAVGESVIREVLGVSGLQSVTRLETNDPLFVVRTTDDPGLEALKRQADASDRIAHIQPNYRYSGDGEVGQMKQKANGAGE